MPDKGFWLLTDQNYTQAEYIKFDSTGKQTAKFTVNDLPARCVGKVMYQSA
ncbi:MAG: hypothetical protein U5N85_10885 [Arcicella sp.]|nr:hypothetical protein [Arcicella sp.]